jgi:internalin A
VLVAMTCGCDEQKADSPKASSPASAAALPTAPAVATPTATATAAEVKPAKPKKKLEDCPKSGAVQFDEEGVAAEVRRKLQKTSGDVSRAELKKLRSLNLSQTSLDQLDVCVFSHMTGLKELFLGQGRVDDLSPLASATQLESLRASMNPIRDVAPLAQLTKLDRLDLGRTQVADLKPLAKLTALTELQLDDAPVEDVAPLATMTKLERLSLQRTRVKDLGPLKGLKNLKFLYLAGTSAADDPLQFAPLKATGAKVVTE